MSIATADELERDPLALLRRAELGEAIVVERDGKPVAEIRPIVARGPAKRPYGLAAGEFTVPDDFDAPLDPDSLRDFEGR